MTCLMMISGGQGWLDARCAKEDAIVLFNPVQVLDKSCASGIVNNGAVIKEVFVAAHFSAPTGAKIL